MCGIRSPITWRSEPTTIADVREPASAPASAPLPTWSETITAPSLASRARWGGFVTVRVVPRYLHTMYRITDPERSREFYEALGFEFRRDLPIVRDGELEATNYFFGMPGQDEELEVDDLEGTLERLSGHGIEPERPPYQVREGGSWLCFVRDPDGYRIELIGRSGS
jgi:lactoylglutathione lyase